MAWHIVVTICMFILLLFMEFLNYVSQPKKKIAVIILEKHLCLYAKKGGWFLAVKRLIASTCVCKHFPLYFP